MKKILKNTNKKLKTKATSKRHANLQCPLCVGLMVNFGIIVRIVKIDCLKLTTNVLFGKLFYLTSARDILIWHLKIKEKKEYSGLNET